MAIRLLFVVICYTLNCLSDYLCCFMRCSVWMLLGC